MIDHVSYLILAHAAGATFTPDDAITVLSVLPQHESVLAAILSRGFSEFKPALAIKHGYGPDLLSYYPQYIIYDDLYAILGAAGALGDLPTIERLWRLVGLTTAGRNAWYEGYSSGLITEALRHGHLSTLEWLARTSNISINWTLRPWNLAAEAGHTSLISWAIAHGHIRSLSASSALLSTRNGCTKAVEWWISQQPSNEAAMAALSAEEILVKATKEGAIAALDWWWAYTGSKLPEPIPFARIAHAALKSDSLAVVECWWTRFLAHRTPEHLFGETPLGIGLFKNVEISDWYSQRYDEASDFFPRSGDFPHGIVFSISDQTTLANLKWAIKKCAAVDDLKLTLNGQFFIACARDGAVEMLDLVVCSLDVLVVNWSSALVSEAIQHGQFKFLEWWDHNKTKIPPQDLDCGQHLGMAACLDAVNVIEWWHAHRFPASNTHWQQVCLRALAHNARRVQLWLRGHVDLFIRTDKEHRMFLDMCLPALNWATPFTLDFIGSIARSDLVLPSSPPMHVYTCMTFLHWWCTRINITVTALLPLAPKVLDWLFGCMDLVMLEFWLQAHLAAGHPFVLPEAAKMDEHFEGEQDAHRWVHDVTVTRKVSIYMESDEGIVPYLSPPLSD